jgi:hypothetical protein
MTTWFARIGWKIPNLRLRKILTAALIAPLFAMVGAVLVVPPANTAQGLNIYFKNESGTTTGITRIDFIDLTITTCNTEVGDVDFS